MRNFFIILSLFIFVGNTAWGYYDFTVPYDEYERFKEFYDAKNEFWRYLDPWKEDEEPVIELKNINRMHNERKVIIKDENADDDVIIIQ